MKQMKHLKRNIVLNKNLIIFLTLLGIIGIIAGTVLSIILDSKDAALVTEYLNNFINNINLNKLNYGNSLLNCLITNIGTSIFVWLLGFSIIGIPLILIIYFSKTFILGFTISSIIINYKLKGCLLAFIYVFPHLVINIFNIVFLSMYALSISFKMFNIIIKKETFNFKNITNKYLIVLFISILGFTITSFFEVYVTPLLLKMIIKIL